jgi:hypothetical protein
MKKILLYVFIIGSLWSTRAQINDNPINVLTEKIMQNELLVNRFLRDFVFIKTNTFKKKVLIDMDKSLAKFDDNLSYLILHLPQNSESKDDFIKLQNLWNVYRIAITNYEKKNYKSLIIKTKKLNRQLKKLKKDVLINHKDYSKNKKFLELADYVADNEKMINGLATAYVLKGGLETPEAFDYFDTNFGFMEKHLKKLGKNKVLATSSASLINDLKNDLKSIKALSEKETFNPKMMYSNVNSYSKKSFKLLSNILQLIK